jgi:transcriptional regulator of acetoin/glycerol metabolism
VIDALRSRCEASRHVLGVTRRLETQQHALRRRGRALGADDETSAAWETPGVLVLDEPTPALAERFLRGDLDPSLLDAHPVLARWTRAVGFGLRADADAYTEGTTGDDLAWRRDRLDTLFREERALIEPIAQHLAAQELVTVLADPEGIILATHGGGGFGGRAARHRLIEGASWNEKTRGTNAIGTAITEDRAVAVVGRAHYEIRNGDIFCYATPVHDGYGRLAAVLDVTGPLERHDPSVGLAVRAAGAALERTLHGLAYAATSLGSLAVIERLVHRCAGPTLVLEATGALRIVNDRARDLLGPARADAPLTCQRVFGVPFKDLAAIAGADGGVRFELRGQSYRVAFDPIVGAEGRMLAALVHLEADRPSAPRVAARPPPAPVVAPADPAFEPVLGTDPDLVHAKGLAARFARTSLPVLLLAETGTGKELFARAIHASSLRAAGPFVPINCGALPAELLASELFGYAPGAFTGASRAGGEGKLAAADRGTLFLDEIGDMPDALQVALLRVLDDGAYHRVGEARARRVDLRIVCATCRDLPEMVERGAFRRDLYYRIQGAAITLPALRARADRVELARALLARLADEAGVPCPALAADAEDWIHAHDWPGNVRELKSALTHALALSTGGPIGRACFPRPLVSAAKSVHSARIVAPPRTRDEVLRAAVDEAVRAAGGNLSEAARRLHIARSTLYRLMRDAT